jgi:medium-chain acyl-[acyl-carrier-protein] hydrolase
MVDGVSTIAPVRRPNVRPRLRVICFGPAGATAAALRTWMRGAVPESAHPIFPELPGRSSRPGDRPFEQLAPLVQALARSLGTELAVPFALFGHSMGALIGFELARELRRQGRPGPCHLFVSAHRGPQLPDRRRPLHGLPEAGFWQALQQIGGTPEDLLAHAELRSLLLPRLRADFAVCETYRYLRESPLPCPISAFGAFQDHLVTAAELSAWQWESSCGFRQRLLAGDHFSCVRQGQKALLQAFTEDLRPILADGRELDER